MAEFAAAPNLWFADTLNWLHLPAIGFSSVALALPLLAGGAARGEEGEEGDGSGTEPRLGWSPEVACQAMLAVGVLLMWSAHGLRLLSLHVDVGPLVLMFFKMVGDVSRWLALVSVSLLSFAAAFFTLFKGLRLSRHDDAECADAMEEAGAGLHHAAMMLLEQLLGADPQLSCFEASSFSLTATSLLGVYLTLTVVLLLNMLIAMMSKSFDTVWEAQTLNYTLQYGRAVLSWTVMPLAPPPLLLLGALYQLLKTVLCTPFLLLQRLWCGVRHTPRFTRIHDDGDADGDGSRRDVTAEDVAHDPTWLKKYDVPQLQQQVRTFLAMGAGSYTPAAVPALQPPPSPTKTPSSRQQGSVVQTELR